jgi:CxxC-x17-CxxC domain-containing protein
MADFKKYNRAGGPPRASFAKRNTSSDSRELFTAECNSCHNRCQVPFRPNGKKPVYCSNCFTKSDGSSSYAPRTSSYGDRRPPARTEAAAPDRQIQELKKQIEEMNGILQRLVTVVDTFNRATALTDEIRKHFPIEPKEAPKAVAKKPAKKVAKTVKKAAK